MNNRKPIFFTADWHIGHANCINFDERPFRDVEHMHEVLIRKYNAQVPDHGVGYFLGDIGVSSTAKTLEVISRLNGTKVLILGNHDKSMNSMYNCGFDVVLNGAVLWIQGIKVTLSHCPLKGLYREDLSHIPEERRRGEVNWHGESRNDAYTFNDEGQVHLHGHIHSRPGIENIKTKTLYKQFDVGVAANAYQPVPISTIESWISKLRGE